VAYNHTNHTQKRQIDRKKIVKIEIESKLDWTIPLSRYQQNG
jgi:hypothetical protein